MKGNMMTPIGPKAVFDLHPKIRWAALSTELGEVIFSEMRPDVESHTSLEVDRAFMRLGPLVMTGISERLTPSGEVGQVDNIIINFEKDSVLLKKTGQGYLAVSVDRPSAATALEEINKKIKTLRF
jgi:hypothetical protein